MAREYLVRTATAQSSPEPKELPRYSKDAPSLQPTTKLHTSGGGGEGEMGGGREGEGGGGDGGGDGQPPKRHVRQFIQAGMLLCMPNSAQHTPPGP